MSECVFTRSNFEQLHKLLVKEDCNSQPPGRTCTTYTGNDPCLEACNLVQTYGNGFSFRDLMSTINKNTGKKFTSCFPSRVYGSGVNGVVLRVSCSSNDVDFAHYAMKIMRIKTPRGETPHEFVNEVRMQKKFHSFGMAPEIIFSDTYYESLCTHTIGIIVMEPIEITYFSIVSQTNDILRDSRSSTFQIRQAKDLRKMHASTINKLVQRMKGKKLTHGDMHFQNVAFIGSRMVLIDFGRSTDFYANPVLDLSAITHTDVFMSRYLAREISLTNLPGMRDKFDDNFLGLLQDNLLCNSRNKTTEDFSVGDLLRYKFFMSQVTPHMKILDGLYNLMEEDESIVGRSRCLNEGENNTRR